MDNLQIGQVLQDTRTYIQHFNNILFTTFRICNGSWQRDFCDLAAVLRMVFRQCRIPILRILLNGVYLKSPVTPSSCPKNIFQPIAFLLAEVYDCKVRLISVRLIPSQILGRPDRYHIFHVVYRIPIIDVAQHQRKCFSSRTVRQLNAILAFKGDFLQHRAIDKQVGRNHHHIFREINRLKSAAVVEGSWQKT